LPVQQPFPESCFAKIQRSRGERVLLASRSDHEQHLWRGESGDNPELVDGVIVQVSMRSRRDIGRTGAWMDAVLRFSNYHPVANSKCIPLHSHWRVGLRTREAGVRVRLRPVKLEFRPEAGRLSRGSLRGVENSQATRGCVVGG
jgi:hypothetical protein